MSETTGNTPRKTFKVNLPSVTVTIPLRLGSAPELRYSPSGQPVISLRGVASRRYLDGKDSTWKEIASWYKFSLWRDAAERLNAKDLQPGDIVMVEYNPANLVAHAYTGKDGLNHASLEGTADRVSVFATNSEATAATEVTPAAAEDEIPF
jgi:single-strand DNA-binding protein